MADANWFTVVLVGIAVFGYYGVIDPRLTSLARPLARARVWPRRVSISELHGVLRLFLAAFFQVAFAVVLGALLAVKFRDMVHGGSPTLLVLCSLVGLGELALGSFVGHILVLVIIAARPGANPQDMRHWVAMSRGGWMQGYLKTIDAVALPFSIGLTVAYVMFEEVVFRGILITFLLPLGSVWAVVLSTSAFATVQAFQMPEWRNAIFPVTGAIVMGIVHGALFVAVPNIGPLVIAHSMFFLVAVL